MTGFLGDSPGPGGGAPRWFTIPAQRPFLADLAGGLKYDRHDLRDILERASARETAARTAAGGIARRLLSEVGIEVFAHVVAIGAVTAHAHPSGSIVALREAARASDLACADPKAEAQMKDAIREAAHAGDTLGGVFEVVATGVPPGLGSHAQWDRKLDGRLAQALMSIPAIKAVEIGEGVASAAHLGGAVHDPIHYQGTEKRFTRPTNHAGGVEGGISNGEDVVCRAYMKPISTLRRALPSVDVVTKEAHDSAFERSDTCAVAAASVVGEAMVALALADAVLEKFGGDSMKELLRNVQGFAEQTRDY